MLKIRLARIGKKKQPSYRFVVLESTKDLYGKSLEILGHYNPFTKVCEVDKDRVSHWVSHGAQLSPTVNNLFIDQNIISGKKVKASWGNKKKTEAEKPAEAKTQTKPKPTAQKQPAVKSETKPETPAEKPKTPATEKVETKPETAKTEEKAK